MRHQPRVRIHAQDAQASWLCDVGAGYAREDSNSVGPTCSHRPTFAVAGKWHQGFLTDEYTPTLRGFDHYVGYYSGAEEHFTHENLGVDDSGNKASHTFNPLTSKSIKNNVLSVTVTSKESAVLADAWATLLNVVGAEKGMQLAEEHQISVLYIINKNNKVGFLKSTYWKH